MKIIKIVFCGVIRDLGPNVNWVIWAVAIMISLGVLEYGVFLTTYIGFALMLAFSILIAIPTIFYLFLDLVLWILKIIKTIYKGVSW